jgi:hypothetical protein
MVRRERESAKRRNGRIKKKNAIKNRKLRKKNFFVL